MRHTHTLLATLMLAPLHAAESPLMSAGCTIRRCWKNSGAGGLP